MELKDRFTLLLEKYDELDSTTKLNDMSDLPESLPLLMRMVEAVNANSKPQSLFNRLSDGWIKEGISHKKRKEYRAAMQGMLDDIEMGV